MKNTIRFLAVAIFAFIASCSEDSEPQVSTPACRIDQFTRTTLSWKYVYGEGQWPIEQKFYTGSITPNASYTSYKYVYSPSKVEISYAFVIPSEPVSYSLESVWKLNEAGLPLQQLDENGKQLQKFVYKNGLLSYFIDSTDGITDSTIVTYDAAGKNIINQKYYLNTAASKNLDYEENFTYDNKVNPFYKFIGYQFDSVYPVVTNSLNNIASVDGRLISYTYNEQGYPVSSIDSDPKGSPFIAQYTCK